MIQTFTRLIILLSFLLGAFPGQGQVLNVLWEKTYGGNSRDWNSMVIADTSSGSLFLIGDSQTNIDGDKTEPLCSLQTDHSDIWLLKLDDTGNILWQKNYGSDDDERIPRLYLLNGSSGEMIFTCYTNSNLGCDKSEPNRDTIPLLSADFWVVKLDASGNIIWERTLGGDNFDDYNTIAELSNGNLAVAGESNSPVGYDKTVANYTISNDYWTLLLDATGNTLSDHVYGGDGGEFLSSIVPDQSGGFLLAGSTNSVVSGDVSEPGQGNYDFWMIKVDQQGNKVWDKRYGGTGPDQCKHAVTTPDGGYLLTGFTVSPQGGDVTEAPKGLQDYWVVKTDAAGNKQWDRRFGSTLGSFGQYGTPDGLGNYWIAGYTSGTDTLDVSEPSYGGSDYWILLIDSLGNKIRDKRFGGNNNDFATGISILNDTSFMAFGYSDSGYSSIKQSLSKGWIDYWLVKFSTPDTSSSLPTSNTPGLPFELYPNPAGDEVNLMIYAHHDETCVLEISDLTGRLILSETVLLTHGTNYRKMNLQYLSNGNYIISLIGNNHVNHKRIIINK